MGLICELRVVLICFHTNQISLDLTGRWCWFSPKHGPLISHFACHHWLCSKDMLKKTCFIIFKKLLIEMVMLFESRKFKYSHLFVKLPSTFVKFDGPWYIHVDGSSVGKHFYMGVFNFRPSHLIGFLTIISTTCTVRLLIVYT